MQQEQIKRVNSENEYAQVSSFQSTKSSDLAQYQLDTTPLLIMIENLLSARKLKKFEDGSERWVDPTDDRVKVFTPYGVEQIMNLINFYVTPNTLLSHYTEERVKQILDTFSEALTDTVLEKYEVLLSYPTPEELYEKYHPIIKEKGIKITDDDLYRKCLEWSTQEMENKMPLLNNTLIAIVHFVESAYRRAIDGAERRSLRQMMHISQSVNQNPQVQQKKEASIFPWKNK